MDNHWEPADRVSAEIHRTSECGAADRRCTSSVILRCTRFCIARTVYSNGEFNSWSSRASIRFILENDRSDFGSCANSFLPTEISRSVHWEEIRCFDGKLKRLSRVLTRIQTSLLDRRLEFGEVVTYWPVPNAREERNTYDRCSWAFKKKKKEKEKFLLPIDESHSVTQEGAALLCYSFHFHLHLFAATLIRIGFIVSRADEKVHCTDQFQCTIISRRARNCFTVSSLRLFFWTPTNLLVIVSVRGRGNPRKHRSTAARRNRYNVVLYI